MSAGPIRINSAAGRPLAGALTTPTGSPRGAVVICHGMLSDMTSAKHVALAERLSAAGWLALRFDFTARGASLALNPGWQPGRIRYSDQTADLAGALATMRARLPEGAPLAVVGSSMGGATSLLTAALEAAPLAALATIAAPARPATPRSQRFTPEVEARWRRDGRLDFDGVMVESGYLDDAAAHDVLAAAAAHPTTPKLFVHGLADDLVPPTDARELAEAAGPSAALLELPGADHRLSDPADLERAIAAIVAHIDRAGT